jgi:Domain of unknown function (DUF6316)
MVQFIDPQTGASAMNSERIFRREDGRWYFRIRGKTSMGPYSSHREASESLTRYTESCRRQSEMSFAWPRWLHVKHWLRRANEHDTSVPRPRQV